MSLSSKSTKIFALILTLIFVNPYLLKAQTIADSGDQSIYELKKGTKILVRMDNEINSGSSSANDTFTVRVVNPIIIKGAVILPADTKIVGRVINAKLASSAGKHGLLEVKFETIELKNGLKRSIEGVLVQKLGRKSSKTKNVLTIIGGSVIGALVGAISKTTSGVLVGAGLGAGVGTGAVVANKGKEIRIKADETFEIELLRSVVLPPEGF